MYIRMYDELKRSEGDNPTIGIVLCSDTDDDIARYSVMHGNEQLFASKYKLYLPTKEELKAEIETQKAMFYLQQQDNVRDNGNSSLKMTFEQIQQIAGIPIDHSFLKYKKELTEYGYKVEKISMKGQTVIFSKIDL